MKQREITDANNNAWTCVQAYAGLNGKVSEETESLTEQDGGTVTVICTPSGGAQTVRLQLSKEWEIELSDDDLAKAIQAAN